MLKITRNRFVPESTADAAPAPSRRGDKATEVTKKNNEDDAHAGPPSAIFSSERASSARGTSLRARQ